MESLSDCTQWLVRIYLPYLVTAKISTEFKEMDKQGWCSDIEGFREHFSQTLLHRLNGYCNHLM